MNRCTRHLSHATSLQNNYTRQNKIVESIPHTLCKVDTVFPSRADRWERNGACRGQDIFGAAAQFSARDRGASLPTARSSRKCAESRTRRETWSSGNHRLINQAGVEIHVGIQLA